MTWKGPDTSTGYYVVRLQSVELHFLHILLVFRELPNMCIFLFIKVGIIPWLVLTSRVSKFLCKMLPEDLFV